MTKKLECEIVQDLLPMYVDDLTSDYTSECVKEHLEECPPCRSIYEMMKDEPVEQVQQNVEEANKLRWYMKKFKVINLLIGVIIACVVFTIGVFGYTELFVNVNANISSDVVQVTELYELENGNIYLKLQVTDGYFINAGTTSFNDTSNPGKGVIELNRTIVPKVYDNSCGGDDLSNACGLVIVFNPETSQSEHIAFGDLGETSVPVNMSLVEYVEQQWKEQSRWTDYDTPLDVVYYEGKNKDDRIILWERGMELPKLEK